MDIIYHCILNYNDILVFVMFQIKMSSIIFLTNFESVLSWYFMSPFFEAVKEFCKFRFQILINRTTLHLLFVGHHIIKNIC